MTCLPAHTALENLQPGQAELLAVVVSEQSPALPVSTPLERLRRVLRFSSWVVIVTQSGQVLGVLDGHDLPSAPDCPPDWLIQTYFQALSGGHWPVLSAGASVGEAVAVMQSSGCTVLPIMNKRGRYTGRCVTQARLCRLISNTLRPDRVGGLATPLGVYMTSGCYSAGAGLPGLFATGFLFGVLARLLDAVGLVAFSAVVAFCPWVLQWPAQEQSLLQIGVLVPVMLLLLRCSPMAGLHAAEHMTINALEADLPLTAQVVRTQPREHRRCGTNLLVLLGGLQWILLSFYLSVNRLSPLGLFLYTLLWTWLVFYYWRPAGLWLQRHFTTKPPTEAQLESGLKAGRELLAKFANRPHAEPSLWMRLWGAGFLQMLSAFMLAFWLSGLVLSLWNW